MREIRYVDALNEALKEEMERDENVFLLGEDIGPLGGAFGVSKGLYDKFGEKRVRQTPISESAIIGTAVGAAMTGLRPVAEIMYIDFITTAMDQVVNQAAKLSFMSGGQFKLPLVIRTQGGSGTRESSQHTQSLEAWFVHTPGLKVVMPSTPYDAKGLLKTSIRDNDPVIFIEHKLLYDKRGEVPDEEYLIPLGEAEIKREGKDLTVIATSLMVHKVLEVAEEISDEISIEVIDPRTLVPLDINKIIQSVKKTNKVLIVHEACTRAGIGAEIVREIVENAFDYLDAPPKVLGGLNTPIPYSSFLEDVCVPQKEDIVKTIKEMIK
ncbi:alpha-ketoacid dehydrogenase subunit beta [Candidatus Desantisbacteria bacterium CG1_02_38_46]|uniref:Alpha-ketoacid dehydrogenase subunit beta n=3 Tax=unclassified Candidatus Desantisiibacteriota TaxID=3106372 RepID=A0A2H9PAT3_9BACT|nr:MAG: alpha-ketoacid dehydrogenase subunit beta [Candidatus Desantisbacteria bacterium CG1_02_38_46]PIU50935.1 MAG: alpha-ketoacid dehydrogenase subunit beta [Candidatus Desantisbacteria bacterium CG07_land_8_20_14_0_80_39_15]PIZ15707.1 MAG: alpha-ketoacid dehydrogenase subunit beta [Candidatus Desantisbacteria bacterium CG_4_10_14_0_8_um_filter_39_17]